MKLSRIVLQKLIKMRFDGTPVINVNDTNSIKMAVQHLKKDDVIAIPTDTIYGLACNANSRKAIQKLYSIKGRDSNKPVAICVSSIIDVKKWGNIDNIPVGLLEMLLPGPITIILDRTSNLDNPYLNPSTRKIGIRIPNHRFVNGITKLFDMPLALTSANYSNETSTVCINEFEPLYKYLGAVFDGGLISAGSEQTRAGSTVVDLTVMGSFRIVRAGVMWKNYVDVLNSFGLQRIP